jgi:hypothetical protein
MISLTLTNLRHRVTTRIPTNITKSMIHTISYFPGKWYTSRFWVNQCPNLLQVAVVETNTDDNVIRCFFELEPAFTNTDANGYFTVYGFSLAKLANGAAVGSPMTPLSRNIEIVSHTYLIVSM